MNHIKYGELQSKVRVANKIGTNKAFGVLKRKIQREYVKQNKDEIKYLKNLIKKVQDNKTVDLSIIAGGNEMNKVDKLIALAKLLEEKQTFSIPHDFSIMIENLSKPLQKLAGSISSVSSKAPPKPKKVTKKVIKNMRKEIQRERDTMAKQVTSIEPFDFFVLLPFYSLTPEQSNVLNEILNLNEEQLPEKYMIFENFNSIVEKKHLTGEYFEYNVKQSDISKKFMELEPSLREELFDFTTLNKKAIQQARKEMLELVTVLKIIYDYHPKDYSNIAPIVINNIVRIYSNLVNNSKNNEQIVKYLRRCIEVLEYRKQKMHQELPQIIKDDDKRKFLTKETASIINDSNTGIGEVNQVVQQDDAELGEHYNDRFNDDGFDDLEMDLDIQENDSSELLGGSHPLKNY